MMWVYFSTQYQIARLYLKTYKALSVAATTVAVAATTVAVAATTVAVAATTVAVALSSLRNIKL